MERLSELARKGFKVFAILALLVVVAGTSLEFLVPKEPLRAVCAQKLQERLGRQVKLKSVSIGPWRGLRAEGLSISEAPDYSAGTFLEVERLTVKLKFLPLLMGRVSVDQVLVIEPKLRVVRSAGRYNFSGLVEQERAGQAPASPAAPAASTGTAAGAAAPGPSAPPRRVDPVLLVTTGWEDPKKKLTELGALAAGAAAGAAANLHLDIDRLRVRRGGLQFIDQDKQLQVGVSDLSVWAEGLTPTSTRTDLDVDGSLLGTLQDQKVEAQFILEARMELDQKYYPTASTGHLILNKISHPSFRTERLRADWDLKGLSPDLTTAQGVVRLDGAPGELDRPAFVARQGKWPALLLYPIGVLAKFRGLGLPDLLKIPYSELKGEYAFQAGSVNIAPLYVRGPLVSINAEGVVNLAARTVGLKANVIMGKSSVGVQIKGPMDAPTVEGAVSFRAGKRKHRTAQEDIDAGGLLDPAFGGDPDDLTPNPKTRGEAGEGKGAGGKKPPVRKQTIKDAESLIDAPLPEE